MIIWVPFSIAVSEDGTASKAGIAVDHLIRECSVQLLEGNKLDVKLKLSQENSKISIRGKWAKIWHRPEGRRAHDEAPVIQIRNVRYIYPTDDYWIVAVDRDSLIAVSDGITVALNTLSDDTVESK